MSSNSISSFFLIASLLFATANPLAHAFFFNQITTFTVVGRVCCTATGTCAAGSVGIPTAPATLTCPTGVVAATITDADGNFVLTANLQQSALLSLCRVNIPLPTTAVTCPLLATGGGSLIGRVIVTSNDFSTGGLFGFFNLFRGRRNVIGTVVFFTRSLVV